MANEIAALDAWILFFSLAILSELIVKCVIQVFWWVCENFRGPKEMIERDHHFQVVCEPEDKILILFSLVHFVFHGKVIYPQQNMREEY
jgi:hypothetical protein